MTRVDFFYDFACPYAYLGHTQIEGSCARTGAELVWRPFLLGGVFRAIGAPDSPMTTMSPAKLRHNTLDMFRWADHFGVPLRMPETHPNRTLLALRAALASEDLPRASKALFAAYWVEGLDVSLPEVVAEALSGAGFDGKALVGRAEDPAIKEELKRRTDEAARAGVFGAPTFVVHVPGAEPELFWGQDRLHFVERALGGCPSTPAEAS